MEFSPGLDPQYISQEQTLVNFKDALVKER